MSTGRYVCIVTVSLGITLAGIAAAFAADEAKPAAAPPPAAPPRLASVKMIMAGIHGPNCGGIAELLKGEGPRDDKAWAQLAQHAALLNESGHVLVQANRCPDGVWADAAAKLRDGTSGVFAAAGRKDLKAAQEAFTGVTASCSACHAKHKQAAAPPPAAAAAPAAKPAVAATPAAAAAAPANPGAPRVAAVKHLMAGINGPSCGSLANLLKGDGPKEEKDWTELVRHASLLNEVGFMLMENNRCPDQTWKDASSALRESSGRVAIAGGSKNVEEARTGFKAVTAACGACHSVHKKPGV